MSLFAKATLDPYNPTVRRLLSDRQALHAVIAAATDGSERPLWRLDGDRIWITGDRIDPDRLSVRLGGAIVRVTDYQPFLGRLEAGQRRGFSIEANIVRTNPMSGRREPIRDPQKQTEWLARQFDRNSLNLVDSSVRTNRALRFQRGRQTVTIQATLVEGTLDITDPRDAVHALLTGMGKARGYGMGMLLLRGQES